MTVFARSVCRLFVDEGLVVVFEDAGGLLLTARSSTLAGPILCLIPHPPLF